MEKAPSRSWKSTGKVEPVFDLKNCGPRSRFMILTEEGPVLVHNCTQATARDLMLPALLRLEKRGYRPLLEVYDEGICERRKGEGGLRGSP